MERSMSQGLTALHINAVLIENMSETDPGKRLRRGREAVRALR